MSSTKIYVAYSLIGLSILGALLVVVLVGRVEQLP